MLLHSGAAKYIQTKTPKDYTSIVNAEILHEL